MNDFCLRERFRRSQIAKIAKYLYILYCLYPRRELSQIYLATAATQKNSYWTTLQNITRTRELIMF